MSEKEPSRASPDRTPSSQLEGAAPGGPFSRGQPPGEAAANPPSIPPFSLRFLIAAIKSHSKRP
jgi:hypothetical protein